jgi:hypothetical protein
MKPATAKSNPSRERVPRAAGGVAAELTAYGRAAGAGLRPRLFTFSPVHIIPKSPARLPKPAGLRHRFCSLHRNPAATFKRWRSGSAAFRPGRPDHIFDFQRLEFMGLMRSGQPALSG